MEDAFTWEAKTDEDFRIIFGPDWKRSDGPSVSVKVTRVDTDTNTIYLEPAK